MILTRGAHGFVNTYGPKEGACNICRTYGPLTEDHVPPKGTLKVPQVDLLHIIDLLAVELPIGKKKRRHCQSGVSFRSLCGYCNNTLLGARYDPALIDFSNAVTDFLKTAITIPDVAKVTIVPGLVARSVVGHLFALGIERTERTPLLDSLSNFVLDGGAELPENIGINYWVYPYPRQVAIRDASLLTNFFRSPPIVFWCLKYFPLGFLVTLGKDSQNRIRLPNLKDYMLQSGNHPAKIPLYFRNLPHQDWPEAPTDEGAVLYGDGAVGAVPHPRP